MARWEVVGGRKGGLVVRKGPELASEALDERLSTGAVLEELALRGERLHFRRVSGAGPAEGWISTRLKDKALVLRKDLTPVLVCFYSGGMKPSQGQAHLKVLLDAAQKAGMQTLVLDHASEEPYRSCKDWQSYLLALQEQVETPELRHRPLILFGHSHGCLQAYGLASRLDSRVLKLIVAARRPPTMPLLDEVWGVASVKEMNDLDETALLEGLLGAWRNPLLESVRTGPLPPVAKKILATVREQYATPCAPGGSKEMEVVGRAPISAPILAIACKKEMEKGETVKKMKGWGSLTSSSFELKMVDAEHMDCLTASNGSLPELVSLVLEATEVGT